MNEEITKHQRRRLKASPWKIDELVNASASEKQFECVQSMADPDVFFLFRFETNQEIRCRRSYNRIVSSHKLRPYELEYAHQMMFTHRVIYINSKLNKTY